MHLEASGKMTIVHQPVVAAPNKSVEVIDPVYRQIRDLVYKTSGIYKAEEKLYLVADGCGRRMKQLAARTPREYWDRLNAAPFRDAELRELLNEITIGETCLFRSQAQLDALRKVILPNCRGKIQADHPEVAHLERGLLHRRRVLYARHEHARGK